MAFAAGRHTTMVIDTAVPLARCKSSQQPGNHFNVAQQKPQLHQLVEWQQWQGAAQHFHSSGGNGGGLVRLPFPVTRVSA